MPEDAKAAFSARSAREGFDVHFSRKARVIEYRDALGLLEFTFDVNSKPLHTRYLEHWGPSMVRPDHYLTAFERVRAFLQSCSYNVAIFGS